MNEAGQDQRKRSRRDDYPEADSLNKRSNADFTQGLHRETCSNQLERDGQADYAKVF